MLPVERIPEETTRTPSIVKTHYFYFSFGFLQNQITNLIYFGLPERVRRIRVGFRETLLECFASLGTRM